MFCGSKNSKSRLYHYSFCRYAKTTKKANQVLFYTSEEASQQGYVPCPFCSLIGRQYAKERKMIDSFCDEHNFRHFIYGGELYVISAGDTAWRVCLQNQTGRKKLLMHESKSHVSYIRRSVPYADRGYHIQIMRDSSLMGYLVYIHKHDVAEAGRKNKEKEQRALQRKEDRVLDAQARNIGIRKKQQRKSRKSQQNMDYKRRKKSYHEADRADEMYLY